MFNRICQVRLVKMREDNKNNQKLLEMDGCPGKIYLEGFLPHEFVKITNLITKHGGIVVSPDDETIILSKKCDACEGMKQPRFHVQWLHDCIRDNRLLDIGKYLLPRAQTVATIDKTLSKTSDENLEMCRQPENSETGRCKGLEHKEKSTKVNRSPANKRKSSSLKLEKNTSPDNEEKGQATRKKDRGSKKRSHHALDEHIEKSVALQQKKRKKANSKKQGEASLSSSMKNLKVDIQKCLTEEDNMDCESSDEADDTSLKMSAKSSKSNTSSSEEGMNSSKSWKDGASSDGEMEKTGNHDDSLDKNESKIVKRRGRYSKEESQQMIEYLTENNLLSKINNIEVWRELAATEMFQKRARSALSLRRHYRRIITENDEEYVGDPKVTDELEKKERKKLKNILGYFSADSSKNDDEEEDDQNDQDDDHDGHNNDDDYNASDDGQDNVDDQ